MKLDEKIILLRKQKGWSQEELAAQIESGIALSKYEYIEKEAILIEQELESTLKKDCDAFLPVFARNIATGVVLCIISVIPLVIFSILDIQFMVLASVSILLLIVACGVYLFVRSGIIKGSYDQLLQMGDFSIEHKKAIKKMNPVAPIYWLSVTTLYLMSSFLTTRWDKTWIIWVAAGIIFAIISILVQHYANENTD